MMQIQNKDAKLKRSQRIKLNAPYTMKEGIFERRPFDLFDVYCIMQVS